MATGDDQKLVGLPPNRIEALADGVFAVAMTVLVLEIHVPQLPEGAAPEALSKALLALGPKIASYAVGFILLGTLWVGHHYQFAYIRRTDRGLLWINLFFLLAVAFLPFCVGLLGSYGTLALPCILYGCVLLFAGACLLGQWIYATSDHRLVSASLDEAIVRALRDRVAVGMVGYGAALATAFVSPIASLVLYAGMPLLYLLPGRIDRHVKPRRQP